MHLALDIILLVIFLLCVLIGVKRGFVRSAAHFVGSILAAFLAAALGGAAAQWLFDALFRASLVEKLEGTIATLGVGDLNAAVDGFFASLPDFILRALESAGINSSAIAGGISSQTGQAAELIADMLAPVFVSFLKVLAVIVLFLLLMMLVRPLADLLAGVFYLPLLHQIDQVLGGVFGFLLALFTVWVVLSALQVFLPMLASQAQTDISTALDQSVLAGWIVECNPLGALFR